MSHRPAMIVVVARVVTGLLMVTLGLAIPMDAIAGAIPAPADALSRQPDLAAGAGPTTNRPATTPAGSRAVSGPRVELREQSPAFVAPTGTLTLRLAITDPPPDAQLSFSLQRSVSTGGSRQQLTDIIEGRTRNEVLLPGITVPIANLVRNADGTVTAGLTFAPGGSDDPFVTFPLDDAGVYPIDVVLRQDDGTEIQRFTTFTVRLPTATTAGPPLEISTIVGLHAPVALQPDGTRVLSATDRTRLGHIVDVLNAHPAVPLTLDPTPETVDALDDLVDPAGAPTVDAVARAVNGRETLSSTYVAVNLDSWLDADLGGELDNQFTLGADTLRTHLHPDSPVERRTWIGDPGPSPADLTTLRQAGIEQLVVPSASVAPLDPAVFDARQRQIAELQPFEVDTPTGEHVRTITTDTTLAGRLTQSDNPALAAQFAVADLGMLYFGSLIPSHQQPEPKKRGVVLAVPGDPASIDAFAALLAGLDASSTTSLGGRPIVHPATLGEVFALDLASIPRTSEALVRDYRPATRPSPSLRTFAEQLAKSHVMIDGYRSMVISAAPDQVAGLDQLMRVAGAAGLTDAERQAYFDSAGSQVEQVTHAIVTPGQEQVTLTAAEAQIPVQIQNDLSFPVDVQVILDNPKLEFPQGNRQVVTLQPGPNRLNVVVRARTSGVLPLAVRVESPDGRLVLTSTQFQVRSTVFSGLGLVLSIGAGFFLLLWWARHFRSVRRAAKLVARDHHPASDGDRPGVDDEHSATDPTSEVASDERRGNPSAPSGV